MFFNVFNTDVLEEVKHPIHTNEELQNLIMLPDLREYTPDVIVIQNHLHNLINTYGLGALEETLEMMRLNKKK